MAKIRWKKDGVVSVETRKGLFVLGQMIEGGTYMAFFNLFQESEIWNDIDLNGHDVLFIAAVAKTFLERSNASKQTNVKPKQGLVKPNRWIMRHIAEYSRVLWEGTEHEIKVDSIGKGGRLYEHNPVIGEDDILLIPDIPNNDSETIDKYALSALRVFPELNERLYLCHKFGKSLDPEKDLIFNRDIPLEYEVYMKIITFRAKPSDMGYDDDEFDGNRRK